MSLGERMQTLVEELTCLLRIAGIAQCLVSNGLHHRHRILEAMRNLAGYEGFVGFGLLAFSDIQHHAKQCRVFTEQSFCACFHPYGFAGSVYDPIFHGIGFAGREGLFSLLQHCHSVFQHHHVDDLVKMDMFAFLEPKNATAFS